MPWPGRSTLADSVAGAADGRPPLILVSLSGRGDKDVDTAVKWFDLDTSGTGRVRGAGSTRAAALPPVELEMAGSSTGAGEEL
jgi:tryptophan synthase beta chain